MYFFPNFRWIPTLSKDILEVRNKYKQPILILIGKSNGILKKLQK